MKCHYCHATFQKTNNSNQSPLEEFIEVKSLVNVLIALLTFCCKLHDKYYPSIKVHLSEAHNLHQLKFLLSNPILHSKNHCTICTWIQHEIIRKGRSKLIWKVLFLNRSFSKCNILVIPPECPLICTSVIFGNHVKTREQIAQT